MCEHVGESPDTLRARHDEVVGKLDEVLAKLSGPDLKEFSANRLFGGHS